jgi:hypothetical protein
MHFHYRGDASAHSPEINLDLSTLLTPVHALQELSTLLTWLRQLRITLYHCRILLIFCLRILQLLRWSPQRFWRAGSPASV